MVAKRFIAVTSVTLATYMVMSLFVGCSHKASPAKSGWGSLEGTFSSYHSALGAGNGMLFRVRLPQSVMDDFIVDSFYLKGESRPFKIVKQSDTATYLEADLYLAKKQPVYGETNRKVVDPVSQKITDSIFIAQKFYPSWISGTRNKVKQQLDIIIYKEIIRKTDY